jgi:ribonuclease inhibitor
MGTQILLDGRSMVSEADFHDVIGGAARAAGLEGYGRNLDALWDVLTGFLPLPVEVRWTNGRAARAALGPRFDRLLEVFKDASEELGRNFEFEIHE